MALPSNAATAYQYLTSHGVSSVGAAGLIGNFSEESGINPNRHQAGGPGMGIAQWSIGGRWDTEQQFAAQNHMNPTDLNTELAFVLHEIEGGYNGMSLSQLNSQPNASAAADYVMTKYEQPKAGPTAHQGYRESQAVEAYNDYTHGGVNAVAGDTSGQLSGVTDTAASTDTVSGPGAAPVSNDIIDEINKGLSFTQFDITHPVQSITNDTMAIVLRGTLVIVGLMCIGFALLGLVEKAGITPPAPVPVPV